MEYWYTLQLDETWKHFAKLKSQTSSCIIPFIWNVCHIQIHRYRKQISDCQSQGCGNGEWLFGIYRILFWGDKIFLDLNSSHVCTLFRCTKIHSICILKWLTQWILCRMNFISEKWDCNSCEFEQLNWSVLVLLYYIAFPSLLF